MSKPESEFLNDAIARIEQTEKYTLRAEAVLRGAAESEPIFAEALLTPQDIRYHAEGPFLHAHVQLILKVLYAIVDGDFSLLNIEEFRRLKGYEAEVLDLEQILKEHVGFFEVFGMCHDVAKCTCTTFSAADRSRGAELGFDAPPTYEFDLDAKRRAELMSAYQELFHEFAELHRTESPREVQRRFYQTYQIQIHYPYHDRIMCTPVYSELLHRFGEAHGLDGMQQRMMEDLVGQHMTFNIDFKLVKPNKIKKYVHLAVKRGYDSELFLKLLQGCLFFDMVCGSLVSSSDGFVHESDSLVNCLKSEHQYAPMRRLEKLENLNATMLRLRNRCFQTAQLDGVALLDLLEMEPGPAFGSVLRQIHDAILNETKLPRLSPSQKKEIEERSKIFYTELIKHTV